MKVSLLLGAGFSYNAGLPLVKDISDKLLRKPLHDYTLWFSSGESKWVDWANEVDQNNGKIHWRGIEIAFILDFMINHYLNEKGLETLNYEKFYYYLSIISKDTEDFNRLLLSAQVQYSEVFKMAEPDFLSIPNYEIFSFFYHLIEDLLWIRKDHEDLYSAYKPYIDFFARDLQLDIFTLNHDLLLETLFDHCNICYNDGFSTEISTLMDDKQIKIPIFNGDFQNKINLLKLHGSIHYYKYHYVREENRHKETDSFKTLDFRTKHTANDVDENGKIIQNFTHQIVPQFITGENKLDIIKRDKMYKVMYSYFETNLKESDKIIIIGYSFSDEHINEILMAALPKIQEVIHIDPYTDFPFKHDQYKRINPLTDQIQFF